MHENHERVLAELRANPEPLIEWAAQQFAALGAKLEWSLDDNFTCTETFVALSRDYDFPIAGNQDDDELKFWGEIALDLGYDTDYEPKPYITRGESSEECLDAGLNCSIDPTTGRCTECGALENAP